MRYTLALGFAATCFTACDEVTTATSGEVAFRYHQEYVFLNPIRIDSPIATGLAVDVAVLKTDDYSPLEVLSVGTSPESVLKADIKNNYFVGLTGRIPGESALEVNTPLGSAGMSFTVSDIETVTLLGIGTGLALSEPFVAIENGSLDVFAELKDKDGKRLVGSGAIEAPQLMDVETNTSRAYPRSILNDIIRYEVGSAGRVSLPIKGQTYTFDVISADTLVEVAWKSDATLPLKVGEQRPLFFSGTDEYNRKVVGFGFLISPTATASVCTVKPYPAIGDGAWLVTAHAAGECHIAASFQDLTADFTFTVTR